MKHTLRLYALMIFLFPAFVSTAQVTQLKANNNIQYGVPLGSIGVMVDSSGALWKTDGTSAGTTLYTTKVKVDTSSLVSFALLNGKIYFAGMTTANGSELWATDGTDAGTVLIKDIESGAGSSTPMDMYVFNNTIYFFAETTTAGIELWKSDGTTGGTVMVKDIYPGTGDSYDNSTFVSNNNILYFNATDGTNGTELWKTDGTSAGTVMIKDINPGSGSSDPSGLTAFGTTVLFSADDGTNGTELWKSDGSAAGTVLVKDIVSGSSSSNPAQFLLFNSKMYFITTTGFPITKNKLWVTDGTGGGTTQVYDFGNLSFAFLTLSVFMNNKFYFSALTSSDGMELWSSDGSTAGTSLFVDINPGTASSNATLLPDIFGAAYGGGDFHSRLYNGKIFFIADNGTNGNELWITDGTVAGTSMVKDVNPGSGSSIGSGFSAWFYTTTGMYYTADDGTTGTELWKSDGSSGGTAIVKDINPGSSSSDPSIFMFVNSHIYFTADDNSDGMLDLYIIDQTVTLPLTMLNFSATLNGKVAQLEWTTASEINTKNFVVQRSADGIHFDNIGTVNAAGNSTQQHVYQFADAGALSAGSNRLYYRLQMVDNDGRFTYSKIAVVTIVNGKLFVVYPNPVRDRLSLTSSISLTRAEVRITDQAGKVVQVQQLGDIQAGTPATVNVSALNKGLYYLQLVTPGEVQTVKFFKN